MKLWNKMAQDQRLIFISFGVNAAQFVIILGLIGSIMLIPTRFSFHVPPDISNGTTLTNNKIPKAYVGQFSFYVWQVMNNWEKNGAVDVFENLRKYGYYLSPAFRYDLTQQNKEHDNRGELQGRVRNLRPIADEMPQVIQMDANTWQVLLRIRDSEYVNGILIKDKEIEYPFRVIRYNGNAQLNPFGLALDGFTSAPHIIKMMK